MERKKIKDDKAEKGGGRYFSQADADGDSRVELFTSGCPVLDCAVSGGRGGAFARGRITNLVGDKSTGKTLLGTEATINYARLYPDDEIYYCEAESAFDKGYAAEQGMPLDRVKFPSDDNPFETVEDFFEFLQGRDGKGGVLAQCVKRKRGALVVLDSLDALSDRDELDREIDKGSYGAGKAKKMSQLFRRLIRKIEAAGVTVIIISQLRDKLNVTFGETKTRTGGRALDFYASAVIWLAQTGKIKKVKNKIERKVGVEIFAQVKKNKIAKPYREAKFPILFDYGVDDIGSSIEWLKEVGRLDEIGDLPVDRDKWDKMEEEEFTKGRKRLRKIVRTAWKEVEATFVPKRRKY